MSSGGSSIKDIFADLRRRKANEDIKNDPLFRKSSGLSQMQKKVVPDPQRGPGRGPVRHRGILSGVA